MRVFTYFVQRTHGNEALLSLPLRLESGKLKKKKKKEAKIFATQHVETEMLELLESEIVS
jgi:hypothetical protein